MMNAKKYETTEHEHKTDLDRDIESLETLLRNLDPKGETYGRVADNLKKLTELRMLRKKESMIDEKADKQSVIDMNTVVQGAFMLLGMGMCIHAEQIGSITTKAFTFVPRLLGIRRV